MLPQNWYRQVLVWVLVLVSAGLLKLMKKETYSLSERAGIGYGARPTEHRPANGHGVTLP